jgi:putative hydrolase of the HAD superfamily
MALRAVVFDLGNTLIEQQVDDVAPLDELTLIALPGAGETLAAVHGEFMTGLLSNTRQSTTRHLGKALSRLGWDGFFDAVLTSTDLGTEKPAEQPFRRILQDLDVQPGQAVMVGNDLTADILGAQAVGMSTIFFSCNPEDWRALHDVAWRPDHVVDSLLDLPRLLGTIRGSEER